MSTSTILMELKKLLNQEALATQTEIQEKLRAQGMSITQSQISRLLGRLGAVKTLNARGQVVYALEQSSPASPGALEAMVTDIQTNEVMIVIHTSPGSAPVIAGWLDQHGRQLNILGTVAGDDTLFIAPLKVGMVEEVRRGIVEYLRNKS